MLYCFFIPWNLVKIVLRKKILHTGLFSFFNKTFNFIVFFFLVISPLANQSNLLRIYQSKQDAQCEVMYFHLERSQGNPKLWSECFISLFFSRHSHWTVLDRFCVSELILRFCPTPRRQSRISIPNRRRSSCYSYIYSHRYTTKHIIRAMARN